MALLFVVTTCASYSQKVSDQSVVTSNTATDSPVFDFSANAEELVTEIMNTVGLQQNFTIKSGKVLNVEADIRRGHRYITYNPEYINALNKLAKDKWASVFILAHEIGHHLNGHTILKGDRPPSIELEADEFAGFILHKMGATINQAKLAIAYVASPVTSKTHPGMAERVEAIVKGWKKAD